MRPLKDIHFHKHLKMYNRPVIPLILSFITGIITGSRIQGFGIPASIVVFLSTGVVICLIIKRKHAVLSPIFLFAALGYISILPWVAPEFPSSHVIHYVDEDKWCVAGTVDSYPFESDNRIRFLLQAETLSRGDKRFSVTGKIRVTVYGNSLKPFVGDRISFVSKIRKPRNFQNPGGFNYERYMAFQKIWVTAFVSSDRFALESKSQSQGIRGRIAKARRTISDFIDQSGSGLRWKESSGVLKALIIGDRSGISRDQHTAFNRSGISHLLAISGLHVGIVASVSFFIFRWMLSFFKPLLWYAWTRKGAAILSFFPVITYGLIAGMSPSTQRAVIMVSVFLMAIMFEREQDLMNTLAIAAMLILIIHPPALFTVSFQLSFAAVFSIIYGLSKIPTIWSSHQNSTYNIWLFRIGEKILSFLVVSLFAILGTMPIVMLYFNQVSFIGLLANLLFVPLIGFVVVPLGLLSAFLYPVSIVCAKMSIVVSTTVLSWALDIVKYTAGLPFAAAKTITPSYIEIGCFYVLAWSLLNLKRTQIEMPSEKRATHLFVYLKGPHRNFNRFLKQLWEHLSAGRKGAVIVIIFSVIICGADAWYWLNKRFWHDDFRVTIIDVGQGSSALLELPKGYCLLIDGGGFSDNTIFDVGERIIAPLLWQKKIKTIDTVILSHPNSDHLNGLLYIAKYFHVKDVWMNNDVPDTLGYERLLRIIAANEIHRPAFKDIPRFQEIHGVEFKLLYPPTDNNGLSQWMPWHNSNNNSIVIRVAFGSTSFLFPGDIMKSAEKDLVSLEGDALESTVLVVPHHGSKTSSTAPFLEKTKPVYAIISSGWKNRFGFPALTVVKRYEDRNCRIYNTAVDGAVSMVTDGKSLRIKPTVDSIVGR